MKKTVISLLYIGFTLGFILGVVLTTAIVTLLSPDGSLHLYTFQGLIYVALPEELYISPLLSVG